MADELVALLRAGRVDEAILLALEHRTDWVNERLEHEDLEDVAETVSEFLQRWLPALPPLERLQAADWAVSNYVLGLVHLDHAYRTGAQLYLDAQAGGAAALAKSMRQVQGFSGGPDAAMHLSVGERLYGYAGQLDAMSFEFVPLEPED